MIDITPAITEKQFEVILKKYNLSYSDKLDLTSYALGIPFDSVSEIIGTHFNVTKSDEIEKKLKELVPVAYITNRKEFYGIEFFVNDDVLIPRPETEILVETVLSKLNSGYANIIDLFTGSGCILLSLLKNSHFNGVGIDISKKALNVAKKNMDNLDLSSRAKFICSDVLEIDLIDFIKQGKINIITANPPYLSEKEYSTYSQGSLRHEPIISLVSPNNGYFYYEFLVKLIHILSNKLKLINTPIYLFMEIGFKQAEYVIKVGKEYGIDFSLEKDLLGLDRVVWAKI